MADKKKYRIYEVPYTKLPASRRGKFLFFLILICYACTWLPFFGLVNQLIWIGPITLPMAWTLFMNAINTAGVILIYLWFFRYVEYR